MQQRNLIVIGVALVLGLVAAYLANAWFSGVEQKVADVDRPQELTKILVADGDLNFGDPINTDNVRLLAWPAGSIPQGAYTEADSQRITTGGNVAIRPIVKGEPILSSRISTRAVLSANLLPNMRAVTIPVDPVTGVAGFVTPGDVVDVLLTRQIPGDGATSDDKMTALVLENIQVLAVDLRSGEQSTDAALGKTATLMVTPDDAKRLALSTQIGRLSLVLRNVEDQSSSGRRIFTSRELGGGLFIPSTRRVADASPARSVIPASQANSGNRPEAIFRPNGPRMVVVRGTETKTEDLRLNGY